MTTLKLFGFFVHSLLTTAIPLVPSSEIIQEIASALFMSMKQTWMRNC